MESTSNTASARNASASKNCSARVGIPGPINELDPRKAGPGHYVIGGAPLSPAGDWTLEFVARVSEFDEYRTTFTVPIE